MSDMENEERLRILNIPKNSFTAFRLTYCTPRYISDTSRCDLLGKVPDMWFDEDSSGLFSSMTHHAKLKVKRNFKSATNAVSNSVQGGMGISSADDDADTSQIAHYNEDTLRQMQKLFDPKRSSQAFGKTLTNGSYFSENKSLQGEIDKIISSASVKSRVETPMLLLNSNPSEHFSGDSSFEVQVPICSDDEEITLSNDLYGPPKYHPSSTIKSTYRIPDDDTADSVEQLLVNSNSEAGPEPELFQQRSSRIENIESEHRKFRHRLKNFVNAYKGKAKKKSHDLRFKFLDALLKKYKPGEIFKISKMLVLTKQAYNTNGSCNFDENELYDSRVYERWKEYLVVIRKTADTANPLMIQFFDYSGKKKVDIGEEPETSFYLNSSINAQFYSTFDKSICLTVPRRNGMRIYILQCSDQKTTLRWLVFLKEVIGHEMDSLFDISIPDLSINLVLKVPEKLFFSSLDEEASLKVKVKDKGYSASHSVVVDYLRDLLVKVLKEQLPEKSATLVANKDRLWFCFKYYDRLEWIHDDSILFYAQNELFKKTYQLEVRVVNYYPRTLQIKDHGIFEEPFSFEGFLLRLSKNPAKYSNVFHPINKALYAYTCDNIIFLTKYFRGEPPSSETESENQNQVDKWAKLPNVYEHNPFPLDENEHITWVDSDSFEERDQSAFKELERRSLQVVKAESLIDVCEIEIVRPLPRANLKYSESLFHTMFWYSHSLADDDFISDSAFEIVMKNGNVIQFHASDRSIRNEWIIRINALKDYWVQRKKIDLLRITKARTFNQNQLKINEYVDSNIVSESTPIETKNSLADPYIHTIDSISMPKCVLMSGLLYQKHKKHSNFNQYYVVLCPGFIILFSVYKRSKKTGLRRKLPAFQHYLTIPIAYCYLYSGYTTMVDLLDRQKEMDPMNPCRRSLPRLYSDGWKSSEEEYMRCFTLWFGKKREIIKHEKQFKKYSREDQRNTVSSNPGYVRLISKLGITGKSMVFMARSRQEREIWAYKINSEIEKNAK